MYPRERPLAPEHRKFLTAYQPLITDLVMAVRALVLEAAPDSMELIYDAYSAVSSGYSFTGRTSDSFIHIAAYAHSVNLGFNNGAELDDPLHLLAGRGKRIRHVRISKTEDLENPAIRAFIKAAIQQAERRNPAKTPSAKPGESVVRAIYARRRRPA